MSSSRRKSIGRGDEASGPVINAFASRSMARGESKEELHNHQYGTPNRGKYTRIPHKG
ncbi:hypothetical protein [Alicyclobacillus sp. SO9]|uniref:hypothetical protein n=1 Tax=Alicyclobacillus sp. SO9 TaxID=2665646 RepID=UPI0018E8BF1A|nr:hypothetical protein [Alicyclobacillus sp. SO9]QQE81522.1 hypothetical protein GI364_07065 [Alicyclobacillus sp. SO9]